MMGRRLCVLIGAWIAVHCTLSNAVAQERPFSIHGKLNFTTGSQLFPKPNSSDAGERAQFFPIEDFFGFGLEVRYRIPETNLALGISADYIRATAAQSIAVASARAIPVEDGYRVIPVELTGYFLIPISGPEFSIYMGGGGGAYFGRRIYRYANVEAEPINQGHGFGIHVLGGVGYHFMGRLSVSAEMKFRDLQFESSNAFRISEVVHDNTVIRLPTAPFTSRVHTDGVVFQISTAISF